MFTARRKKNNCEDVSPESQYKLLFFDALVGYLAGVERLVIDCGIDPNIQDNYGRTPLHEAARSGSHEVVKFLLEHGANPNIQDKDGDTPLHIVAIYSLSHFVAESGYFEVMKLLLEHGANPNIQDYKHGLTPLHSAVMGCHVDVVRVLLEYGADPTIRDNKGRIPLDYGSDCEEIIEVLRRRSGGTTVRVTSNPMITLKSYF